MTNHIERWQKDTTLLADFRMFWNDELDISSGVLQLKMGNKQVTYPNVLKKPTQIAEYLANLLGTSAEECFKTLQSSKNESPEFYEKIALFQKQVKTIYSQVSDLEYQLRNSKYKKHAKSYSKIFELSSSLLKRVKKYKSELRKPTLEERPAKHFEYNERTKLSSIKYYYPERVPLTETVAAAKKALSLAPSTSRGQRILKTIAKVILFAIPIIALSIVSVLKIAFWDSYISLIHGQEVSSTPLLDFFDAFILENTDHWKAYQALCKQILRQPHITKEIVNAFKEVSSHAETLDLLAIRISVDDLTKLEGVIPNDTRPSIDVEVFKELLDVGFASPHCRKIKLSNNLDQLPAVRDALKSYSFQLKKQKSYKNVYVKK